MAYIADVYRILIASPSDVHVERDVIRDVLHEWNARNGEAQGIFLESVMWESHSFPKLGQRTQAVLNEEFVDNCDILIGVFWTRLGTPTGVAASGTEEEIDRFRKRSKPVMLYFSDAPISPARIDLEQYESVKAFRERCMSLGLIQSFSTIDELVTLVRGQLTQVLRGIPRSPLISEDKGVRATPSMSAGKVSDDFLREEPDLSIILKDGHTFLDLKRHILSERLRDMNCSTRILILHPDYKYIGAVADMDQYKKGSPRKQKHDCLNAVRIMHEIRELLKNDSDDLADRVPFVGYRAIPTWNGFIGTNHAIIHLYPTIPYRGDLQTIDIAARGRQGSITEWFQKYRTEFDEIRRIAEADHDDSNLWKYNLKAAAGTEGSS